MNNDLTCLKCYLDKNQFKVCCLKLHYSKHKPFIKLVRPAEAKRFLLAANSLSVHSGTAPKF